jgi:O-antigen ligase
MTALSPARRVPKRWAVPFAVLGYVLLCLYVTKNELRDPSTSGFVMAIMLAVLPFAFMAALRAPLIFPFCFYIAFIPFDNLSDAGAVGSGERIMAAASIGALLLRTLVFKEVRVPSPAVAVWGVVILYIAASTTWAMNQEIALDFAPRYFQLFLLLAIVAAVPVSWPGLRTIIVASIAGGVCAAIYGDYLFYNSLGVSGDKRIFVEVGDRSIDPNHFAAALILPFALSLIGYLRLRAGLGKLGMLVITAIMTSGFLCAGSRGALTAISVMLLYFLFRSKYRVQLISFAAIGAFLVLTSSLTDRFALALSSGGNGRTSIWRTALVAFKRAWLFGSGTGNFPDAYDRVWLEVNHGTYKHWHIVAHNLIAQTGVELGVVGLVLVLAAWYVQFRSLKGTTAPEPYGDIRIALEGATLGLFTAAMFLDIMWYKYCWAGFMLSALARQYARSFGPSSPPPRQLMLSEPPRARTPSVAGRFPAPS